MAASLRTADDDGLVTEDDIISVKKPRQICIHDLPEEILIVVFGMTCPYRDFKSIMLVCQEWNAIMADVIYYHNKTFYNALTAGNLKWHCHDQSVGVPTSVGRYLESTSSSSVTATVTERYSHSACYYDKSVYVFGGCASTSTTFNDLWRFDLGLRAWIRPLATGSYPSPKACATLTAYKDCLILFGGWSHHSLHIFHQSSKFFNQLHVFHPFNNKWTLIDPSMNGPEGKAGHGATVIGDNMIVFGGYQGLGTSCNDVWVLDLLTMNWTLKETTGAKPSPRYNHTQAVIDGNHILVLGGCGGPNMQLTDAWLLTISLDDVWQWDELDVVNLDQSAPQLMCHQACVVKDKLVVLSKNNKITPPVYTQICTNPCRLPLRDDKLEVSTPKTKVVGTPAHRDQSCEFTAARNDVGQSAPTDSQAESSKQKDMRRSDVSSSDASIHPKRCCPDSSDSDSEETSTTSPLYVMSPDSGAMLCALTLQNEETRNHEIERMEQPAEVVNGLNAEGSRNESGISCSSDDISVDYTDPDMHSFRSRFPPSTLNDSHTASFWPGVRHPLQPAGRTPSNSRPPFPSTPRPLFSPQGSSTGSHPGLPSIRPNAMNNRQRQLETLRKYEERLRARKVNTASNNVAQSAAVGVTENVPQRKGKSNTSKEGRSKMASSASTSKNNESFVKTTSFENRCCCDGQADYERFHRTPLHPMFVHTLDLSEAVSWLRVTWLPISVGDSPVQGGDPPPEETIFYSLVEGRGELVLFGGIQGDMATMQRAVSSQTKNVTNALFFLTPPN